MMVYSEEDWKAEVEVVRNDSDEEWDRFTLKVIRTLQPSRIYKSTPDGTVFSVVQRKGFAFGGMWTLCGGYTDQK